MNGKQPADKFGCDRCDRFEVMLREIIMVYDEGYIRPHPQGNYGRRVLEQARAHLLRDEAIWKEAMVRLRNG